MTRRHTGNQSIAKAATLWFNLIYLLSRPMMGGKIKERETTRRSLALRGHAGAQASLQPSSLPQKSNDRN